MNTHHPQLSIIGHLQKRRARRSAESRNALIGDCVTEDAGLDDRVARQDVAGPIQRGRKRHQMSAKSASNSSRNRMRNSLLQSDDIGIETLENICKVIGIGCLTGFTDFR